MVDKLSVARKTFHDTAAMSCVEAPSDLNMHGVQTQTCMVGQKRAHTETEWLAESEIIMKLTEQVKQLTDERLKSAVELTGARTELAGVRAELSNERRQYAARLDEIHEREQNKIQQATHATRHDLLAERRMRRETLNCLPKAIQFFRRTAKAPSAKLQELLKDGIQMLVTLDRAIHAADVRNAPPVFDTHGVQIVDP